MRPTKKVPDSSLQDRVQELIDAYMEASKDPAFKHRNWFRSEAALNSITEQINGSWTLLADHAEEYMLPSPK